MKALRWFAVLFSVALVLPACDDDETTPPDVAIDARPPDARPPDARIDAPIDARPPDARPPDAMAFGVVHGCQMTDYMTTVAVAFADFAYTPKCIQVSMGTMVTFTGTFSSHPLLRGLAPGHSGEPASSGGPFPTTAVSSGMTATFTFNTQGFFPFYCTVHGGSPNQMNGTVWVTP